MPLSLRNAKQSRVWNISQKTDNFVDYGNSSKPLVFKGIEFDAFKNESGSNYFTLTPQKWINTPNATVTFPNARTFTTAHALILAEIQFVFYLTTTW